MKQNHPPKQDPFLVSKVANNAIPIQDADSSILVFLYLPSPLAVVILLLADNWTTPAWRDLSVKSNGKCEFLFLSLLPCRVSNKGMEQNMSDRGKHVNKTEHRAERQPENLSRRGKVDINCTGEGS